MRRASTRTLAARRPRGYNPYASIIAAQRRQLCIHRFEPQRPLCPPATIAARRRAAMILNTCAACAKPIEHDAPSRCVGCQTRYCSDRCLRYHAHRGGHDENCDEIASGGGAESGLDARRSNNVSIALKPLAKRFGGDLDALCAAVATLDDAAPLQPAWPSASVCVTSCSALSRAASDQSTKRNSLRLISASASLARGSMSPGSCSAINRLARRSSCSLGCR